MFNLMGVSDNYLIKPHFQFEVLLTEFGERIIAPVGTTLTIKKIVAVPRFPRLGTPTPEVGVSTYYLANFLPKTT